MKVINISPRGYCYGVVDAMVIAKNAALDETLPRPIVILGMIVHNKHVTDSFEAIGIHTVDGNNRAEILSQIDSGTVIFTAHGISPEIVEMAKAKGLVTIDASCPDVQITHEMIANYSKKGYETIYIGKAGHPEPEGAIGVAPNHVHLVSHVADVEALALTSERIFVTNQTTMSQWDVADVMDAIRLRYPNAEFHKEICHATQIRQEAVATQASAAELTIVIGDPKSNNTNRLAQVSMEQAGVPAKRVADVSEIDPAWLMELSTVAVTAGASTPTAIITEAVRFLENFDAADESTWAHESHVESRDILPKSEKIRDLTAKRAKNLEKLRVASGL
jgi:4-hydroxy-3-methylbut-2-enyl diphosphate reductase